MKKEKKTLNDCTLCGLCKSNCPVFRATKLEHKSARARAIHIKDGMLDETINQCTLCDSCAVECPENIDLPQEIRKAREQLVRAGKISDANMKMIENIRKYGNPFGKQEKGKIQKDLYCC